MEPYQERVVAEKDELRERLTKLNAFLRSPCLDVPKEEFARLLRQQYIMELYALVLQERIAAFE